MWASPVEQSAVPDAVAVIVRMPHVLVCAPPCELFGIGNGGPKRQPAVVQFGNLQLPMLQAPGSQHVLPAFTPPEHVPPEHVPPGQLVVWHALPSFGPPMQMSGWQSKSLMQGM